MSDDQHPTDPTAQTQGTTPAIFEAEASAQVRRTWHEGRWFYSVVDVCGFLTDSPKPRNYWAKLKSRLSDEEQSQVVTKCQQLKLRSPDGKMRETDCADRETLLRIVQSIPSPKAESFKRWLARVGEERLTEMEDPAAVVERLRRQYAKMGYSDEWIAQRLRYIAARNAATDEWAERGAEGRDYAILTDTIHKGTFDITTREHKQVKQIGARVDLQDNMTPIELALDSLAHVTATEMHRERDSQGVAALQQDACEAGAVGGEARAVVERALGHTVISDANAKQLRQERMRQLQPPLFGNGGERAEDQGDAGHAGGAGGGEGHAGDGGAGAGGDGGA